MEVDYTQPLIEEQIVRLKHSKSKPHWLRLSRLMLSWSKAGVQEAGGGGVQLNYILLFES